MSTGTLPDDLERLAQRRATARLGWYAHAVVYVAVNLFLIGLAALGTSQRHWPVYPALGWGLGLALHGIAVFLLGAGAPLRERLVQQERERLARTRA